VCLNFLFWEVALAWNMLLLCDRARQCDHRCGVEQCQEMHFEAMCGTLQRVVCEAIQSEYTGGA
jgi:hypothetical protein